MFLPMWLEKRRTNAAAPFTIFVSMDHLPMTGGYLPPPLALIHRFLPIE